MPGSWVLRWQGLMSEEIARHRMLAVARWKRYLVSSMQINERIRLQEAPIDRGR